MHGPGPKAVCMCACQRRLLYPDSWRDEAVIAKTHNKPDEHPSAAADWQPAAKPKENTRISKTVNDTQQIYHLNQQSFECHATKCTYFNSFPTSMLL